MTWRESEEDSHLTGLNHTKTEAHGCQIPGKPDQYVYYQHLIDSVLLKHSCDLGTCVCVCVCVCVCRANVEIVI